jgi:hypothetical protein
MMKTGLDFSWSKPSISAIKAEGYSFVIRYLSYDHNRKNLTHAEAASYSANHIDVVSNWEAGARDALKGYAAGHQHATAANDQHHACGGPSGAPIYFSADFDVTPQQQAAVNDYLRGVASVIGIKRVGVYGGYYTVKRCAEAGLATFFWQTYAWSGGQWFPRAQLRQVRNGIKVGGADCDLDHAMTDHFGQWKVGHPSRSTLGSVSPVTSIRSVKQ